MVDGADVWVAVKAELDDLAAAAERAQGRLHRLLVDARLRGDQECAVVLSGMAGGLVRARRVLGVVVADGEGLWATRSAAEAAPNGASEAQERSGGTERSDGA